ncbi:MAG: NADH-quinone oxidoreductase subunit J [Deltaproteobacteria bacterium]|jgi:NADH-quinone oxidoreductase subunit J|nr:NADH-quinone oxidoreductase subunit J [Deltaproteobacteria bacterium]MBW2536442.1 NADH-quinone oxidoreductase subunit J [Deltaproteobacteria bacterium]
MPSMHTIMFFLLAALALGSAGVVALSKNIIYSALALLGTFLGVAGLYITLSADFLAATQLLVYVGGTLTLILFAVMLTARIENLGVSNPKQGFWAGFALVLVVLVVLGTVAAVTPWGGEALTTNPSTAKLGHAFLDGYLLPFEVGSVVLLAALVGSVVLARRAVRPQADKE